MFGWIHRFFSRKIFTIAAAGTLSDENDFKNSYPTRVFVENTTGAPTSLLFDMDDPTNPSAAFVDLYTTAGSLYTLAVTPGKWVAIDSDISKLIGASRIKVACAAWSAGGRIFFDTCT
jgi:hypothetical protein